MEPVIGRYGEQALGRCLIENQNSEPIEGRRFQTGENDPREHTNEDANQDRKPCPR